MNLPYLCLSVSLRGQILVVAASALAAFGFVTLQADDCKKDSNAPASSRLDVTSAEDESRSVQPHQQEPVEPKSTKQLSPQENAALAEGQSLFRGLCSGCHGGMGRGGKGPDLTDNRWLHGDKDEDIARVLKNGVAATTMKKLGEALKEHQ